MVVKSEEGKQLHSFTFKDEDERYLIFLSFLFMELNQKLVICFKKKKKFLLRNGYVILFLLSPMLVKGL